MVKFWHMDNTRLLKTIDADGGLPVSSSCLSYPRIISMCIMVLVQWAFIFL